MVSPSRPARSVQVADRQQAQGWPRPSAFAAWPHSAPQCSSTYSRVYVANLHVHAKPTQPTNQITRIPASSVHSPWLGPVQACSAVVGTVTVCAGRALVPPPLRAGER